MNILRATVCLSLLLSAAAASAQSPSGCPSLPSGSDLQWQEQVTSSFVLCKASTADGREVMSLMLSSRDPGDSAGAPAAPGKGHVCW
jgi:hypothetical protein